MKYCFVVPHYNHAHAFQAFVERLLAKNLPCIVVDDGSDAENKQILKTILQAHPEISLAEHDLNYGKGKAMWTGATLALKMGFTHMIQIDADGQHDVGDVDKLIAMSEEFPTAIISGAPQFDDSAPKSRLYGRKVTDFWVALETWSLKVKDSLCGFRVYPLKQYENVYKKYNIGKRMQIDTDILVKSIWEEIDVKFVDTKVIYHEGGVSHFHYLRDNLRLIWLHIRLMIGMVVRAPVFAYKKLFSARRSV